MLTETHERREAADEAQIRQILVELFREEFAGDIAELYERKQRQFQQWLAEVIDPLRRVWVAMDIAPCSQGADQGSVTHHETKGITVTLPVDIGEDDRVVVPVAIVFPAGSQLDEVIEYQEMLLILQEWIEDARNSKASEIRWLSIDRKSSILEGLLIELDFFGDIHTGVSASTIQYHSISLERAEAAQQAAYEYVLTKDTAVSRATVGIADGAHRLEIARQTDTSRGEVERMIEAAMLERVLPTLSLNEKRELHIGAHNPAFLRARMRDIAQVPVILGRYLAELDAADLLLERIKESDFFKRNTQPRSSIQDVPRGDEGGGPQDAVFPGPQDGASKGLAAPAFRTVDRSRGPVFPPN